MSTVSRNAAYNLVGFTVPLVLFLVTIPLYIQAIGAARYGVLAIVWLVLGLFGMMDLGLGRAATQRIAALKDGSAEDRRAALGTALASNIAIGAGGALLMAAAAWYTFGTAMELEPWLREEAMPLVPLMAIAVPLMTTIGILSGALQGREKFLTVNKIQVTNTSLFQLLPLAVAWIFGPTLIWLVIAALAARFLGALLLWRECRGEFGGGAMRLWTRAQLVAMLKYGGWVTLGAMVGMVLVFSDRFLIGAVLGAVAVTIYAVPLDATRRIAVIADALANALFPRLAVSDAEESRQLTRQAVGALYAIATPPVAVLIVLADPLMRLWLGEEIGAQSAPLLQILAIAGWANIFAKVPYARLQAQGRPDLVAKLHILQVAIFVAVFWFAIQHYGVIAAAWVQVVRASIDTFALLYLADRSLKGAGRIALTLAILISVCIYLQIVSDLSVTVAIILVLLITPISLLASWYSAPHSMRQKLMDIARGKLRNERREG